MVLDSEGGFVRYRFRKTKLTRRCKSVELISDDASDEVLLTDLVAALSKEATTDKPVVISVEVNGIVTRWRKVPK